VKTQKDMLIAQGIHIYRVPFRDAKVCGLSARRIMGPLFYEDKINYERYVMQILLADQ
jgi:hypothetical protein